MLHIAQFQRKTPMKTHDLPIKKKLKKSWLTPFTQPQRCANIAVL